MYGEAELRQPVAIDPATLNVGQDGALYILSLANLRQDNMDTPAAVNSPVGMMIETWNPNTLGADIVTNGAFPVNTTGWTARNAATLSAPGGRLRVTSGAAANSWADQSLPTTAARVYKVTVDLVTNANGAQIAVGSVTGGTTLFLTVIPAGVTGSYTFYFFASNTTSFIQLRTASTTIGHFTEWDNVVVKHIPGKHWLQQISTSRPILRQDAFGCYWLEGDGIDDWMPGPRGTILQLPSYLCALVRRVDPLATKYYFGISSTSTNYHLLRGNTTNAMGLLRESVIGQVTQVTKGNSYAAGRTDAIDSLAVVGQLDINTGRTKPETIANAWLPGTVLPVGGPTLFSQTGTNANPQNNLFGGSVWMNSAPTLEERSGMRRWFNDLARAD